MQFTKKIFIKFMNSGFVKLKASNRISRLILYISACLYVLCLVFPSSYALYNHYKKSREKFLPKIDAFKIKGVEEAGSVCFMNINNIDPVNLIANVTYTLLLKTPNQILDSNLVDISNLSILVDFTPSYFRILEDFTSNPKSTFSIPLSDFYNPFTTSSEYYMKSKKYDISLPIMGYLRNYPLDVYILEPSINIRLENYKNGNKVKSDFTVKDVGQISVSNDARLEVSGFELSRAHDPDKREVVVFKRERLIFLHVLGTLLIGCFLVIFLCIISLSNIKNPVLSTWESIIGGSAVMFSMLSLRPILVPSYVKTITFVDTCISFFVAIIVGTICLRFYLVYIEKKFRNKNTDSHV